MKGIKYRVSLVSTLLCCAVFATVLGGAVYGFAESHTPAAPECDRPRANLKAAGLRLSYAVSEATSWELTGPNGVVRSGNEEAAKTLDSVVPGDYTLTARHRISITPTVFDESGRGEQGEEKVLCEEVATASATAACPQGNIFMQEDALVWQAYAQGASLAAAEVYGPDGRVIVASPVSNTYQGSVQEPAPGLYTLIVTAPSCSKQRETVEIEEPEPSETDQEAAQSTPF